MIYNANIVASWVPFSALIKYSEYQGDLYNFQKPLRERANFDEKAPLIELVTQIDVDHQQYIPDLVRGLQKANQIWYLVFKKTALILIGGTFIAGAYIRINFPYAVTSDTLSLSVPILVITLTFIASIVAYYKALTELAQACLVENEWARGWLTKIETEYDKINTQNSFSEQDKETLHQLTLLKAYLKRI